MDSIECEKARAVANFNRYRRLAVLRQIVEMLLVVSLVSWSSAKAIPCFFYVSDFSFFKFSSHSVFLLGNAIIILLLAIHRSNGVVYVPCSGELCGDRANSEFPAAADEKVDIICNATDIVVYKEEKNSWISQSENAEAAIRTAAKRMERFRRTESEKLRRDIGVRTLGKAETIGGGEKFDVAEINQLSNEEFRRVMDLYIERNWRKKKEKNNELVKVENFNEQL
ncbi:hypothetical protein M569_15956 [Genlisea aurea]|uniref:DUF4408 domain-containing protein n=1 Tax=Genlisea aurea TaxID=192259 RepID=S8C3D8_9LAMI|nr:hypothetical protein M569_15956 [Genlisea aurea]